METTTPRTRRTAATVRRLAAIRQEVRGDREARAARKSLQHELSSYTTA